jgi:hypothetical protein
VILGGRRSKDIGLRGLTFELTGPMRRDGLARAERMYRVPQPGPRQPAVAGPVVQRGVRRHLRSLLFAAKDLPNSSRPSINFGSNSVVPTLEKTDVLSMFQC